MTDSSKLLPDFENPPVVETVLSVQFEALTNLRSPQIGLLWQEFRDKFPRTDENPPLEPVFERFGVPATPQPLVQFQMLSKQPTPRCWFLNEAGTQLIQIQQDRFVHNWRKVGMRDTYPRYESVKSDFEKELNQFREFLSRNQFGELTPNQCEVTYVNHIVAGAGWTHHGDLGNVFSLFSGPNSDQYLSSPEDGQLSLRYLMPPVEDEPLGRLHVAVASVFRTSDTTPMFLLTLTARGKPLGYGIEGVLEFLDAGREWIVRAFASITTSNMHAVWGRKR